jgi:16S rRNA (cytidine1402-2'-O)-methyltransferase
VLFIVATPLGNLGDLAPRAVEVLAGADLIAAEDTRRCLQLLSHLGLSRPIVAYHDHNEERREAALLGELRRGRTIALVADAGTPLISDPGFRLVRAARAAGVQVSCVPGPCAAVAALSVAGLPSDRFVFEGFLPARAAARQARLAQLLAETRTLIFYESPRRLLALLDDLVAVIGAAREAVIARELTKRFETVLTGTIGELRARVAADADQQLGEIVVLLRGAEDRPAAMAEVEPQRLLQVLLARMPLSEAVDCAVEICGLPRNRLYRAALALQSAERPG